MRKKFTKSLSSGLLFIFTITLLVACKAPRTMEEGNKAFEKKDYNEAADIYKDVGRKNKNRNVRKEAYFKEGLSHLMNNNYKDAERALEKSARYKSTKNAKLGEKTTKYLADALKLQGKFADAIIKYDEYLKDNPDDEDAKKARQGCELALKWKDKKTRYVIENFKRANTRESDFAPYFLDKKGLVFTSARAGGLNKREYGWTGMYYDDMYICKMKRRRGRTSFERPVLLEGEINTKYSDGVATFGKNGRQIYYTQCNDQNGKGLVCKIYQAKQVGRESYQQPTLLPFNSDSFSCGHPAISPDGKMIIFASNMKGGEGGWDLYMVNYVRRGRTWSEPLNLGPTINTKGDEMYPYIHEDGELYFASNGHVTLGGLDMYKTTGTGQEWKDPENLKSPLNSGGDDFGLWLAEDKESGYFTSNRDGGRGSDDIYSFTMKPCELFLSGVVRDEATKAVIPNARVYVNTNKDTATLELVTDETGAYKIPLTKDTKYELMAKGPAKSYYFDSEKEYKTSVGVECFTTLVQDFELKQLEVEFTVEGILYDLDKAFIRPDAAQILDDSVVAVLERFPMIKIELGSHTDCRASHAYNDTLSQARADSAVEYIVSKGIDPRRIVAKGYGENELRIEKCKCGQTDINRICTEAEHQLNRRTTVKVLDKFWTAPPEEEKPEEKPKPNNGRAPNRRR